MGPPVNPYDHLRSANKHKLKIPVLDHWKIQNCNLPGVHFDVPRVECPPYKFIMFNNRCSGLAQMFLCDKCFYVCFPNRFGGKLTWSTYSPDLSPFDFFLQDYGKYKVYRNQPKNIDELKICQLKMVEFGSFRTANFWRNSSLKFYNSRK